MSQKAYERWVLNGGSDPEYGDRGAIIGIMGNQSMGLWNGKSISFQHILIFSFAVLSIQFQELVYVRV